MKKYWEALQKTKQVSGENAWKLLILASLTGVLWFFVESSFVFILQAFLVSLGLVDVNVSKLQNQQWLIDNALLAVIAFGFFRSVITFLKTYLSSKTSAVFIMEKRQQLFSTGLKYAHKTSNNDIISVFSDVVGNSGQFLVNLSMVIGSIFSAILFFSLGLLLAPTEMMIGLFCLFILVLPLKWVGRQISAFGNEMHQNWSQLLDRLLSGLKNQFLIRIYHRTDYEIEKGHQLLAKYKGNVLDHWKYVGISSVLPSLGGVVIIAIITVFSQRYGQASAADLISVFYLFMRFAQSSSEATSYWSNILFYRPSFERLTKVLHENQLLNEIDPIAQTRPLGKARLNIQSLEFESLSFGFERRTLATNLDLKIMRGESLAILGESGSGKSTLLNVILGIQAPLSGRVTFNGEPLSKLSGSIHEQTGYVGPDPFLIQVSIKENLLYGHPNHETVTEDQIWEVISAVGLQSEIKNLSHGLHHVLTENSRLSTGQKQRLSIARAMLRQPQLLILDEGTANLDGETENQIFKYLDHESKNFILIFVTHKESLAQRANRVLRIGLIN